MSVSVSPTLKVTPTSKLITVAAGCFWGVERVFQRNFKNKGIVDLKCGYANGIPTLGNVNYEMVCTGSTAFIEGVQISYEPSEVSVLELLDYFFRIHDPTTLDAQGPDVGQQYRSAIMTHTDDQHDEAWKSKEDAQRDWYPNHKIVTIIEPIKIWYDAELYHQQYLDKNPGGYECPTHFLRKTPKI